MNEQIAEKLTGVIDKATGYVEHIWPELVARHFLTSSVGLAVCMGFTIACVFGLVVFWRWTKSDSDYIGGVVLMGIVLLLALTVGLWEFMPAIVYPEADLVSNLLKR